MASSILADGYGLFWNSEGGDRKYNAESFENWLKKFFTSGVFANDLQVVEGTGMAVQVNTGYANTDGKVGFFGDDTPITLDTAHSTYDRIDTIVVERNDGNREITIHKVTGVYSDSTPVPTAPIREGGIYQLVLAEVYVAAGVSAITQADITDKREDSDVCGYVTGTVTEIDFSQITAQFEAYYEQFRQQNLAEFDEWFQHMKDQLDEDAAGHLQNEIGDLDNLLTTIKSSLVAAINEVFNKTPSDMTGATSEDAGTHGLVPAPQAGDEDKVLKGDGTWGTAGDTATVRYDSVNDRFQVLLNGVWVDSIKAYADNLILFDGTTFYAPYENGVYSSNSGYTLVGGFAINLPNFVATLTSSNQQERTFIFRDQIDLSNYSALIVETSVGTLTTDLSGVSEQAYIGFNTLNVSGDKRIYIVTTRQKTNFGMAANRLTQTSLNNLSADVNIYNIRLIK